MATPDQFDIVLRHLEASLRDLTSALDSVRNELGEEKLNLKGIDTRLDALEASVGKLSRVVIEGNGSESLKATVGSLNVQIRTLHKRMDEAEESTKRTRESDAKIKVAYITALAAAAGTIIATALNLIYGGDK